MSPNPSRPRPKPTPRGQALARRVSRELQQWARRRGVPVPSAKQLERATGVPQTAISSILRGDRRLGLYDPRTQRTLERIAVALGLPADTFHPPSVRRDRPVGERVRAARLAHRWSQLDLGRAAGLATITIIRIETGSEVPVSSSTRDRIARVLGYADWAELQSNQEEPTNALQPGHGPEDRGGETPPSGPEERGEDPA